jgi:hypothetical protein
MYGAHFAASLPSFFSYRPGADNLSSLDALLSALDNLENLCNTIEDQYSASLQHDDYERWEEKS